MSKYRSLQIILIRKFMIIIILVSVIEYGVVAILNRTLIPFIMFAYFGGIDGKVVGMAGFIILSLLVVGEVLLEVGKAMLPDTLNYLVNPIIGSFNGGIGRNLTGGSGPLPDITLKEELSLLALLILMLVIVAMPYIVGAMLFSRAVVREVGIIEEENRKLQKEYEQKRNLMLSDIAHDLRTPMTTVSGYAQALNDGMVDEERSKEYLQAIQTKSGRMNELITLLFDYVRLDSEGFKLTKEKTDICEVVREAAAFIYQDIEDAGMELDIDIPEEQIMKDIDKIQFSRVITNLLTNAIKHNKPGTKIGLFLIRDDDNIRIMVADTGEEIDAERAKHLFEPFVMGDESRNSKGGSGLGLSIAKKIMDMHNFRLRLVQNTGIRKFKIVENYTKMFMITIPE